MVQAGTLFEYLAAFVTILLAIAIGDLAHSFHRLLRARQRVIWDPLPLVLASYVLLVLLTMFFAIWGWTNLTQVTFYELLWKSVPLFVYFLAASAVLPDEVPDEGLDLRLFYMSERRYFLPVLMLGFGLDSADQVIENWSFFLDHPRFVLNIAAMLLATLASLSAMLWREERWVHWVGAAVLFGCAHVGFSGWLVEGASAVAS
jgi:hypothetical protein